MSGLILIDADLWASTRAGARAGRGFRYQDAVAAWLATEGWRARYSWAAVVPEGVDDITLHGDACEIRAQLKSRHDPRGAFSLAEAATHIAKTAQALPAGWADDVRLRVALVLERPVKGLGATGWGRTFASGEPPEAFLSSLETALPGWSRATIEALALRTHLVVESHPMDRAIEALEAASSLVGAAARLAAQQLRDFAGLAADANYTASAIAPQVLGATEVQARVVAVSGLIDPTGLITLTAGLCEVADFGQGVEVPDFYSGVDVTPAHVGAGLVFERPHLMCDLLEGLQTRGAALVAGPSGAGKSALAWLAAYHTRHAVRWHRVRSARLEDVGKLVQFARHLDVGLARPVGFVVDDVGREEATSGWDALVKEVAAVPGLLVLGTIREEDLFPLRTLARTSIVRPTLDEPLAERVWKALSNNKDIQFAHWREPFDLSHGLMLEYTHLLMQGRRLEETVAEQVRRRLEERRDDELAVLAVVAFATAQGGIIDPERLRSRLGWETPRLARALRRLIDEHAIRRVADGGLAGLHEIRSTYLDSAIQDLLGQPRSAALVEAVHTTGPEHFAKLVVRALRGWPSEEDALLSAAAERLADPATPVEVWIGILHGLGLATADRVAAQWLAISRAEELDDRQSAVGFTMAVAGTKFGIDLFAKVDAAITKFEDVKVVDLRRRLLDRLDDGCRPPIVDLAQAHEIAAALLPLAGCAEAPGLYFEIEGDLSAQPLVDVLELIQTVREASAEQADEMIKGAGGVEALLDRLYQETPWITHPMLAEHEGAVSVCGYVRHISPDVQPDIHADVVRLCELMSIAAPQAEWIVSDAILADGRSTGFGDFRLALKCMPRSAIGAPPRVPWNRAQLRALGRLTGAESQTGRTTALARAIEELSGQLKDAADFFCRQETPGPWWSGLRIMRTLLTSFIAPPRDIEDVSGPRDQGVYGGYDALHGFATDVERLVAELVDQEQSSLRLMAFRAKGLAETATKLRDPNLWRMTAEDPLPALALISTVLWNVAAVLIDADADIARLRSSALRLTKTSRRNNSLARAAREARERMSRDVTFRIEEIEALLAGHGLDVEVFACTEDEAVGLSLLNAKYLALLKVEALLDWFLAEPTFLAAAEGLPDLTNLAFAPLLKGVVAPFGLQYLVSALPYAGLVEDWSGRIPYPILEDAILTDFKRAMDILALASTILQSQGRPLLGVEEDYLAEQLDELAPLLDKFATIVKRDQDPVVATAAAFLIEQFERVQSEWRGEQEGALLGVEAVTIMPPSPLVFSILELNIMLAQRGIGALVAGPVAADDTERLVPAP